MSCRPLPVCTFKTTSVCAFRDARVFQICVRFESTHGGVFIVHPETRSMHTHLAAHTPNNSPHVTAPHPTYHNTPQHAHPTHSTHTHQHHRHQQTQDVFASKVLENLLSRPPKSGPSHMIPTSLASRNKGGHTLCVFGLHLMFWISQTCVWPYVPVEQDRR